MKIIIAALGLVLLAAFEMLVISASGLQWGTPDCGLFVGCGTAFGMAAIFGWSETT